VVADAVNRNPSPGEFPLLTGKNTGNLAIFAPWHTWADQNLLRFEAFALKFPASIIREIYFQEQGIFLREQ
jgi:hypothetical protein